MPSVDAMDRATWPEFELVVPCPGHVVWDNGKRLTVYCKPENAKSQRVEYGAFVVWVTLCYWQWHECQYQGAPRWRIIADALAEHYGPVRHESLQQVHAWTYWSNRYSWDICACGKAAGSWDDFSARQYYRLPVGETRFCSWACCAEAIGATCAVCGLPGYVPSREAWYGRGRQHKPFHSHGLRVARRILGAEPGYDFVVDLALMDTYCSRNCCSLAVAAAIRREREERHKRKELQCVRTVKVLLGKARKSLNGSLRPEAWPTLREAFKRAATSPG